MFRKIVVHLLIATLLVACLAPVAAAPNTAAPAADTGGAAYTTAPAAETGAAAYTIAPENTEYERYREEKLKGRVQTTTSDGKGLGYTPSPVSLSHLKGKQVSRRALVAAAQGLAAEGGMDESIPGGDVVSLPASYDLRTLGKVTPVRNQGSCGSCWAFATYGSMESVLEPGETWDFSENNLKNKHGYDGTHCAGGNAGMSTAYLARYAGPVSESDDPYNPYSSYSPSTLTARKHVQDVLYIPDRSGPLDNDNIKNAVQVYGGIYSLVYWTEGAYSSATKAYYYSGTSYANHAITIVGWDDNYDRSRFRTSPPGNGAFIVRNSWGTGFGEQGYFYVSYYDKVIGTGNAVFTAESTQNYQTIYQYDTLGWLGSAGYGGDTAYFANVFTASRAEQISAASFYTASPNSEYQVSVYTNPSGGPVNAAGPLSTKTGTIAIPGYHTVILDTPVPVTSGQKFSVVVRLRTPGYSYPIPLEKPITGFASNVNAASGQSYMSSNGVSWADVAVTWKNHNVCLKAFSTSGTPPPPPSNPVPVLSTISPSSATAGDAAVTLTATGSSFVTGSTVRWNGADRPTTHVSSTQLTASIPASDIAAAGTASVTVFSPEPGGGTSAAKTFTITAIPTPPPGGLVVTTETATTYSYLGYSSTYRQQAQSLKAADTGITQVAVGLAKKGSPTREITVRLRSILTGPDLATATITPAMVTSTDYLNPTWVTVSLSPESPLAPGSTYYLVLSMGGYDLRNYYRISLNRYNPYADGMWYKGSTGSAQSAYDMLVKAWFGSGGSSPDPMPTPTPDPTPPPGPSPVPVLSTISPSSATAGDAAVTLTATGSSFVTGSTVRWNGADRPTTHVSSTQLTASIPASDIAAAGTASVTVFSPEPGGGTSAAKTFTITATPTPPPGGLVVTTETATTYSYLGYSSTYLQQAQSVKAAGTGITQVAVALARKGTPSQDITIAVRSVLGGTDLATATITPAMVTSTDPMEPGWVTVPVEVTGIGAGSPVYLVLSTPGSDLRAYYWTPLNSYNPYPDGTHYKGNRATVNSNYDMLVRVWFTS